EGRLVAIYGMLSLVWLAIAANLAYRIYLDRVGGLITGLWRAGWPQGGLGVAGVLWLAPPFRCAFVGWPDTRGRRALARARRGWGGPPAAGTTRCGARRWAGCPRPS